jgi:hypothetical protein
MPVHCAILLSLQHVVLLFIAVHSTFVATPNTACLTLTTRLTGHGPSKKCRQLYLPMLFVDLYIPPPLQYILATGKSNIGASCCHLICFSRFAKCVTTTRRLRNEFTRDNG